MLLKGVKNIDNHFKLLTFDRILEAIFLVNPCEYGHDEIPERLGRRTTRFTHRASNCLCDIHPTLTRINKRHYIHRGNVYSLRQTASIGQQGPMSVSE